MLRKYNEKSRVNAAIKYFVRWKCPEEYVVSNLRVEKRVGVKCVKMDRGDACKMEAR